ncbi:ATP-binding protein [Hydrogenophaga sp. 5NK40-0174]|uniref:ATP-binding protein n=1 Tax=Hydrogenophaga sp. 5NK40-0174 TaxID=3127649 RepID=UPI0031077EF4
MPLNTAPSETAQAHNIAAKAKRRLPLGPSLVALLLIAALLPAVAVTWTLSNSSAEAIQTLAENTMRQAVRRMDLGALNHLRQAQTVLNALADPQVSPHQASARGTHWLNDDEGFERLAFSLTEQARHVPYVYFGKPDGTFIGVEREEAGHVVRIIRPGQGNRQHFLARTPGDRTKPLLTEGGVYDPRERPWYQLALSRGNRVFTDVYRSAVKQQFDLTLAQPIFDTRSGRLLGVVATDLSLDLVNQLVRSTPISDNAVSYLVDSQGLIVASSVDEALTIEQEGKRSRLSPDQSRNALVQTSWAQLRSIAPAQAGGMQVLNAQEGSWLTDLALNDRRLLAMSQPFGQEYGLNWRLVVVAPELDFTAQVLNARRWSFTVLASLLVISGLIAYLVANGLSRQFRNLSQAASRLGSGEVPDILERTPFEEVHDLSGVMHASAVQLQQTAQEVQEKNEALRRAAKTLEARVQARTAELTASRADALAAAEAKAGFLAVMSHEIRNPLNGVLGMSELLGQSKLDATQTEMLDVVRTSGVQLLAVVNDILDFSRIEAGKLELDLHPFALAPCIQDVMRMVELQAAEKQLPLTVDIDERLPGFVMGDAIRIKQILLNLLNNAVKFTSSGGVTLTVQATSPADGQSGPQVHFEVSDTGMGISAESMSRLFHPFAQGDSSTTRMFGGSGLGLAICHHLVAMMGGQLQVRSTPGQGSHFWFDIDLPAARAPVRLAPSASNADHDSTTRDLRVLIVDDDETNCRVAGAMIEQLGHAHASVSRASEAISLLAMAQTGETMQPYTHVLIDRHMPKLDGLEAARRMRSVLGDQVPVIIGMSASSLGEDQNKCLEAGMSAYLSKPLSLNVLANALSGKWQKSAMPASNGNLPSSLLPWIDTSRLDDFAAFDDENGTLRREVLTDFLRVQEAHLLHIGQALTAPDASPAQLSKAIHALIGAAENVGAKRLGQRCSELEMQAAAGKFLHADLLALTTMVEHTRDAILQTLKQA